MHLLKHLRIYPQGKWVVVFKMIFTELMNFVKHSRVCLQIDLEHLQFVFDPDGRFYALGMSLCSPACSYIDFHPFSFLNQAQCPCRKSGMSQLLM